MKKLFVWAVFLFSVKCALPTYAEVQPNIVFILVDDLGIQDLQCYGSDYYETPHIDSLAGMGMMFNNAYSAHSVCSSTRSAIATGRSCTRLHLTSYIPGSECPYAKLKAPQDWIKYLRTSELTYAEALQAVGYASCHIGKWHLGEQGSNGPENHGFETVIPYENAKNLDDPWYVDKYTTAAENFMTKNADKPFLLTLSHGTVHVPLYEKEDLIDKYKTKTKGAYQNNPVYAAMVERLDWSTGRILQKISDLGIEDNTIVVFASDNGGLQEVFDTEQGKSITATSNKPYRGGKSQNYEGGIRVPLIIKWPGVTASGSESDVLTISMDLYPTFLSMAGLEQNPTQHLDGFSLAPILKQECVLDRNTLYWHYPHNQTMEPHSAIRCGEWKLVYHYNDESMELFNVKSNAWESINLTTHFPEITAKLKAALDKHLNTIGAQMPTDNPDYDSQVYFRKDSHNGEYDIYENDQQNDPRRYVINPDLDYGYHLDFNDMGIDNIGRNEFLEIYPNPSSTEINLKLDAEQLGETIKLFDIDGKLMISQVVTTSNEKIDISFCKRGNYLITVGNYALAKFIKY